MNRRKGTPCACESDPCGCGSSKGKCIRAINNVSPDPNGDFTVEAGAGILISEDENKIVITNINDPVVFQEGQNIEINISGDDVEIGTTDDISVTGDLSVAGDSVLNGDLNVNGNIYNQGASYESHMEQVFTENDYIIMRDNAVTGLAPGDFSGFQVKKYDGTNDGRLVIDDSGTARVGDVGDEQPLLTREESANLTDGALLKWDASNSKAVDEGTVGTDTQPVKIVNGIATPVTDDLMKQAYAHTSQTVNGMGIYTDAFDTFAVISIFSEIATATGSYSVALPFKVKTKGIVYLLNSSNQIGGSLYFYGGATTATLNIITAGSYLSNMAPLVIVKE